MEDPRLLEEALSWTKFPPVGVRGFGLQPSQVDYEAISFGDTIAHLNANTLTVLQIESAKAVEMRDEILSVPGIDAVFIGPADLSISMGIPGDFQNPRLIEAIELIRETCEAKGVAPGIHTRTAALGRFWRERGMRFLGCGSDVSFLWEKASETAKDVLR
jgi:2-dehydro-3-deoxyglucarate aldolase/4-hydroxy-2-oxoheptanedioate aldolase